jgi:hypothetical protein
MDDQATQHFLEGEKKSVTGKKKKKRVMTASQYNLVLGGGHIDKDKQR